MLTAPGIDAMKKSFIGDVLENSSLESIKNFLSLVLAQYLLLGFGA